MLLERHRLFMFVKVWDAKSSGGYEDGKYIIGVGSQSKGGNL